MALNNKPFHKTKQHLIDVMNDMLRHATIEDITIKALVQEADVTRSTFYTYYSDKYALFEDLIAQCNRQIYFALRYVPAHFSSLEVRKRIYDNTWQVLTTIYSYKHIFSQINPEIRVKILEQEIHSFKPLLVQQFKYLKVNASVDADILATFYLSGIISTYNLWIANNFSMPIEELCEQVTDLTMTIYSGYIDKE